ncbi:MAG: nicotinate-nucleotide adenylyltransferase, partial [Pseudomonadota bacterium]|nr:nicotinate-nucleotide adenylyltransferase [Pseudomonadota bacterium]
ASGTQRLAMIRAAVEDQTEFVIDERELRRSGGSYSYDTLLSLRSELGPDLPLCLLVGADAFGDFLSWYRPDDILELAHLVVMGRPGTGDSADPALRRWAESRLTQDPAHLEMTSGGRILFQEVTQMDISATAIRNLVARGLSPRFLLPDPVLRIIEREALYRV